MGIPKFFKWLRNQEIFKSTIGSLIPTNLNAFGIDLPGIIHENAMKYMGYGSDPLPPNQLGMVFFDGKWTLSEEIYQKRLQAVFAGTVYDIMTLVKMVRPKDILIACVDGVAPQAKLTQSRGRRYKTASELKPYQIFDPNQITPGTEFMILLDQYLREAFNVVMNLTPEDRFNGLLPVGDTNPYFEADHKDEEISFFGILPPTVIYSGHLTPGEGEHKISDHLKNIKEKEKKSVMIYGADADLFMIYLLQLKHGWEDIYLLRENKTPSAHARNLIVDLKRLEQILSLSFPNVISPANDFVAFIYLIGNDFLPHFATFERIEDSLTTLMAGYREFLLNEETKGLGITDGYNIVWENFYQFLAWISDWYGDTMLKKWAANDDGQIKNPSPLSEYCLSQVTQILGKETKCVRELNVELFNELWYPYIFSSIKPNGVQIKPTQEDIDEMIKYYLEGLTWVNQYYTYGVENLNVNWYYPYHFAPLFSDLAPYIKKKLEAGDRNWIINPINERNDFISPLVQMIMVLPPRSISVIPDFLRSLYNEYSQIADLLPYDFKTDSKGKMEGWQEVAILPLPNPNRVTRAVLSLGLPESVWEYWDPVEDTIVLVDSSKSFARHVFTGQNRGRGRGRTNMVRGSNINKVGGRFKLSGLPSQQEKSRKRYQQT